MFPFSHKIVHLLLQPKRGANEKLSSQVRKLAHTSRLLEQELGRLASKQVAGETPQEGKMIVQVTGYHPSSFEPGFVRAALAASEHFWTILDIVAFLQKSSLQAKKRIK